MSLIERVVGAPGRLLDVGSGMGEVLMCASRRGWLVQGVEPEHFAAETAIKRGVPTEAASLQESGVPEGNWDVVSAFHVLEHISDADGFLRLLARWANPGGHVVIEVPNFAGVQRRRRRQGWEHLRPMQHIAHYTPRTLAVTLQRSGLQPRLIQTPTYLGPPQDLDQAIYDLARGERLKRLLAPLTKPAWIAEREVRIPNRIGWLALRAIEEIYDRAGVGAVVLAVAQLPTQRRGQAAVATRPSALAAGRRVPRT